MMNNNNRSIMKQSWISKIKNVLNNRWCALFGSFLMVQLTAECSVFENHAVYLASVMACHSIGYERCGDESTVKTTEGGGMITDDEEFENAYSQALNNLSLVYTFLIVFQGLGMGFGGHLQNITSLKTSILVGVICICFATACAGWVLSSVIATILVFGIIQGLGIGFVYMAGVSTVNVWFGDNLMALWIGVSSSTLAPSLIDPMQSDVINPSNIGINSNYGFMKSSVILDRTPLAMIYTAVLYLFLGLLGLGLISEPNQNNSNSTIINCDKNKKKTEEEITIMQSEDITNKEKEGNVKSLITYQQHHYQQQSPSSLSLLAYPPPALQNPSYSSLSSSCSLSSNKKNSNENTTIVMMNDETQLLSVIDMKKNDYNAINDSNNNNNIFNNIKSDSEESVPLSAAFYYREFWYLAVISFANLLSSYWVLSTWKVFGSQYLSIKSDYFLSRVGGLSALMSALMRAVCSFLYDTCFKGQFKSIYGFLLLLFTLATVMSPLIIYLVPQYMSIVQCLFLIVVSIQFTSVCVVYNLFPAMVRQTFGPRYVSEISGFLWGLEGPAMLVACGMFVMVPDMISWMTAQLICGVVSLLAVVALVVYPNHTTNDVNINSNKNKNDINNNVNEMDVNSGSQKRKILSVNISDDGSNSSSIWMNDKKKKVVTKDKHQLKKKKNKNKKYRNNRISRHEFSHLMQLAFPVNPLPNGPH